MSRPTGSHLDVESVARAAGWNSKRRWGYLVWAIGASVILVPECIAAFDSGWLPFTTISHTTGHLERRHPVVELVVIAVIVWVIYSTVRVPPRPSRRDARADDPRKPVRTYGGRLTIHRSVTRHRSDEAPAVFGFAVVSALAVIALAAFATASWGGGPTPHYAVGYVLYGLLALFWIVVPSMLAITLGKDMPFPTLYRTVTNLEDWLANRPWRHSLGPSLAWVVSYAILTALIILFVHLTLYPFPDITRILNPNG